MISLSVVILLFVLVFGGLYLIYRMNWEDKLNKRQRRRDSNVANKGSH